MAHYNSSNKLQMIELGNANNNYVCSPNTIQYSINSPLNYSYLPIDSFHKNSDPQISSKIQHLKQSKIKQSSSQSQNIIKGYNLNYISFLFNIFQTICAVVMLVNLQIVDESLLQSNIKVLTYVSWNIGTPPLESVKVEASSQARGSNWETVNLGYFPAVQAGCVCQERLPRFEEAQLHWQLVRNDACDVTLQSCEILKNQKQQYNIESILQNVICMYRMVNNSNESDGVQIFDIKNLQAALDSNGYLYLLNHATQINQTELVSLQGGYNYPCLDTSDHIPFQTNTDMPYPLLSLDRADCGKYGDISSFSSPIYSSDLISVLRDQKYNHQIPPYFQMFLLNNPTLNQYHIFEIHRVLQPKASEIQICKSFEYKFDAYRFIAYFHSINRTIWLLVLTLACATFLLLFAINELAYPESPFLNHYMKYIVYTLICLIFAITFVYYLWYMIYVLGEISDPISYYNQFIQNDCTAVQNINLAIIDHIQMINSIRTNIVTINIMFFGSIVFIIMSAYLLANIKQQEFFK